MRSARSAHSVRSSLSPEKRPTARDASPGPSQRSRPAGQGQPPPMPDKFLSTAPATPPVLLRAQSETLPRFGASDTDPISSPDSPSSCKQLEHMYTIGSTSGKQLEHVSGSPASPPCKPSPSCKSSPPCKVPDPRLVAP